MAVLQKLRTKFGLAISIIVAIGLLSFIIDPSQIETAVNSMSSKYDVGKIAGKSISYTDFQEDIDRYTAISELISGTSVKTEEEQQQIRNAAWQELVDKNLFIKNAKNAGLTVGEDEMLALTTGDLASPLLSQNAVFLDEDGNFSSQRVVDFVQTMDSDASGSLRNYWNYVQNSIHTQQYYNKYGALMDATSYQNPLMLSKAIEESNVTNDVEFVMVPYLYTQDSTVVVTDKEIKDYYNSHKDFFKQVDNREVEYVVYEVVPSSSDITATREQMNAAHDEFATTDNVKNFLLKNSDRTLSTYWYKDGELNTISSDINDFVFGEEEGVSPIFTSGNTFYAAKVVDTAMLPDSVYVKHILVQGTDAQHLADSLVNVANSSNFSNLAALYSADQGSAADGELGSIGWMTQNYMIPGMESVITADLNKPYVLNTQYGTHVVLVSEKTKPIEKKQVAILEKTAIASNETFNNFYAQANEFATLAHGSYDNYKAAVDTLGVYSHVLPRVLESTSSYGAIDNAKEVTRWIFDCKKADKVSDIITVNQNYFFVVALKEIHKEGYAPVQQVASTIQQQLYNEAYGKVKTEQIAQEIAGMTDLEAIAEKLNSSVSTQSGVTFSQMSATLDPVFIGALANAPLNQVCGPIAGSIGTYIFKVTGRDTGSFYTEDDAKSLQAQKNDYNKSMLLTVMMEDADVVDHRDRFF